MEEAMEALSQEARELSFSGGVERVQAPISPLRFLREFVMPGRPCIVMGAIEHWSALRLWSNQYLRSRLQDQLVSVHFTPDGRADAILDPETAADAGTDEELFMTALVETMPFPEALDAILQSGKAGAPVAYAQQQNDCFRSEYQCLRDDAELHIPWATEALGAMPEAVNLWIGTEKSSTSYHKDHYENLYAVVSGTKSFTLLPPVDVHRLYVREYPCATYARSADGTRFTITREPRAVPWVSVDPYPQPSRLKQASTKFPRYFQGPGPFKCTVRAGELLYLPSMWYHHVRQADDPQGRTVAVNFWYDMQFDVRYAYFNFLQSCVSELHL